MLDCYDLLTLNCLFAFHLRSVLQSKQQNMGSKCSGLSDKLADIAKQKASLEESLCRVEKCAGVLDGRIGEIHDGT